MLVNELVKKILDRVSQLDKDERKTLHILVRVESRLAFSDLLETLRQYLDCKDEVSKDSLKPLLTVLEKRWQAIRLTDASYCHAPDSLANRAYLIQAEEMASVQNCHAYDLLMPGVNFAKYSSHKGSIYDLTLQEFIFGDSETQKSSSFLPGCSSSRGSSASEVTIKDVGHPIDIYACLLEASKDMYGILRSVSYDKKLALAESEDARVKLHSQLVTEIYFAIKTMSADVSEKLSLLKGAIVSPDYLVCSRYGEDGKRRLLSFIMKIFNDLTKLSDVLSSHIPKDCWVEFLREIKRDELSKLILKTDTVMQCASQQANFRQNKSYDAAVLFLLAFIYKGDREQAADYKSYGYGWFREYSKMEKLAATEVVLAYLLGKFDLSLKDFHDNYPCQAGVLASRRLGAMNDGELGAIAKAINERITPTNDPAKDASERCVLGFH